MRSTLVFKYCFAALGMAAAGVFAQPVQGEQAAWRVANRLGYGPTPAQAEALAQVRSAADGQRYALGLLEAAHAQSGQPPKLQGDMERLAEPLPELGKKLVQALADRRNLRNQTATAATSAGAPSMAGEMIGLGMTMAAPSPAASTPPNAGSNTARPPAAAIQTDPYERIGREMVIATNAWRIAACTNPDVENPLLAKLTEFWFNHFNVFVQKAVVRPYVGHYVTGAIRPNVLGKFEDLVIATAKHPAMLGYLDQNQSVADNNQMNNRRSGLNENYARELMELHTLGVNGGYTQQDVREMARVLTGWSTGFQLGEAFRFYPNRHDKGTKTVLGHSFKDGGEADGIAAIRMLTRQSATAQRVALRMAQWFVADEPPAALVQRLAQVFEQTQGDLYLVTLSLIQSPEFWDAQHQLVKTPMDYACSTLAAAGGLRTPREGQMLSNFLDGSGQGLHRWQTPDGYKVDAATWLAPEALTRRADFAMQFAQARSATAPAQWPAVLPYISAKTSSRVAQEAANQQAGLMLASPDFMRK